MITVCIIELTNYYYYRSSGYLRNFIPEQRGQLVMGTVSDTTPASGIIALPQPAEADGQPLLENGVGLIQLLKANRYDVVLQTHLLRKVGERTVMKRGGKKRKSLQKKE